MATKQFYCRIRFSYDDICHDKKCKFIILVEVLQWIGSALQQDTDCCNANCTYGDEGTYAVFNHIVFCCFQVGSQCMNFLKTKSNILNWINFVCHYSKSSWKANIILLKITILTRSSLFVRLVVSAFWFASSSRMRLHLVKAYIMKQLKC